MWERIKNEPAVIVGLLESALILAAAFGLHLTVDQLAGISAFGTAVLALFVRSQVTPTNKIP